MTDPEVRTHDTTDAAFVATQDERRVAYIERVVVRPLVAERAKMPWMRSAAVLVAQYWDDEAADAVHVRLVPSRHELPDLEAWFDAVESDYDNPHPVPDTNIPADAEMSWDDTWSLTRGWDDNDAAIPLFATYCTEHGSQMLSERENYRPVALIRFDTEVPSVVLHGERVRPWLDGVRPEWADDE